MSQTESSVVTAARQRCERFRERRAATPISAEAQATLRTAMERSRNYRGQEAIETVKLPRYYGTQPGEPPADGYGPNGEPRYHTREKYKNAGRAFGLRWDGNRS